MSDSYNSDTSAGKKAAGILIAVIVIAVAAIAALYLIDVDQTKEAKLPSVDVDVKGGQMPKFDADVADIDIKSKSVDVEVPTVEIDTTTKSFKVPTIDITQPAEDDPADQPK